MSDDIRSIVTLCDLDNLQHMLGIGKHISQKNWGYRNYAVFYDHNPEYDRLVELGLCTKHDDFVVDPQYMYRATEEGARIAGLSEAKIKKIFYPKKGKAE